MTHSNRIVTLFIVALLACASAASAQQIQNTLTPTSSGGGYAWAIVPVADVNGDGAPELLLAEPFDDSAGTDAGRVSLVSGADASVLLTLTGDQAGDLFGYSISGLADLDADGKGDFVVGAPGTLGSGATGYARVYSGADGSAIFTFSGTQPDGQFGAAVGGSQELMADNEPGVIVGASAEGLNGSMAGAVYVYSGVDGHTVAGIPGAQAGDKLGSSVSGDQAGNLGGLNPILADNEPGVIVGATADGNGGAGYVLLLRRSDLTLIARIDGDAALDGFGASVAPLGDVNGDGIADVGVGTAPSGGAAGYARILSGADGSTLHSFSAATAGTGFGSHVAWVGDLSEDGIADLAVSEPGADGNGTDSGRAHIYSGADGSVVHTVHGPDGSNFATSIAYAGDLDGDGLTEIVIGAPTVDNGSSPAGAAYVVSLTRLAVVGSGEGGVNGVPELRSEGRIGDDPELVLHLTAARANSTAMLVMGSSLVLENNKLVPKSDTVVTGLATDGSGSLEYAITLPPNLPPGFVVYYQYQVDDLEAPNGVSRSNTIAALLP